MPMLLCHCRTANRQNAGAEQEPSDDSGIEALCSKALGKLRAMRNGCISYSAAFAFLQHCASRNEDQPAFAVVPVETRPHRPPAIAGHICPTVAINILTSLVVGSTEDRVMPPLRRGSASQKTASVPSRDVRLIRSSCSACSGRRETRLTTPPSADEPYSADATPLMISTCPSFYVSY